jgi:PAS domain S-box-containing protein
MDDWTPAPTPIDETDRLARLARLGVQEGQRHSFLDVITQLAAQDLGAPIVLVSLVDEDRQWFLARHGLEASGTGRAESFCGHCVTQRAPLIVGDALEDRRFAENPLVVGEPRVRSYLGVPLFGGPAQSGIGTLCVVDRAPRAWTPAQQEHLARLASLVETYLENLAYRRVWEDSPLSFVLLDADARCVRVNPAFGRMLGRPVSTILDKPLGGFVLPGDRPVLAAMHTHVLTQRTSPTRRELRFSKLNGEVVSGGVSMSFVSEYEGHVVAVIRDISLERRTAARSGVVAEVRREIEEPLARARDLSRAARDQGAPEAPLVAIDALLDEFSSLVDARIGDISARVRVEAELAASEQRVRTLMEHVLGPLLVLDDRGRIVDANSGALQELGWKYEQLVGASMRMVKPAFSDATCRRWFRAAEAQIGGGVQDLVTFVRRDGSELRVELRLMCMDWNGPGRLVVMARDVTEAQAREATLVRERDDLAIQLQSDQKSIDELQRVEAELKASLEEKDTMLKEIHHRVKNNLQMVSSLLTLQMDQMQDERMRSSLADSVRRVRSMALIHQHLYGSASLERVELGSYARSLAEALRATLAPRARVRADVEILEVPVDRAVPLCLLLNELLTNAFKYGSTGAQGAAGDDWDVRVSLERVDIPRGLRLVVQDRGPGLPEGFRLQGHPSLGLQLVTTLARQTRGTVEARNDRGARFEVTCPV